MSSSKRIAIIHGNKLESLVEIVETYIKENPLSPLENETFLIYNNGVGQWLKQYLAQNNVLGIAAGLEVKLPSMFIWDVYRAILGQQIPKEQPLAKQPLTWRLYRLLPKLITKPEFQNLAQFLANDKNEIKRHQLAETLADLFDQYQMYRADWLSDWEKKKDNIRDGRTSIKDEGEPLKPEQIWQAQLWREILNDMNESEKQNASRSSVHDLFIQEIKKIEASNKTPENLPKRIIVFGIPTLPQQHIEVLAKIAQFSDVILFVTNPCQHYWADIIEDKDLLKAENRRQKNKNGMPVFISDEELHLYANPLLAAWGKQGRDYIRLLDQFDENEEYKKNWGNKIDFFEDCAKAKNACLLRKLQQTILDLEPIPSEKITLNQIDNSIDFHIAHSPQREIEILHDQLLARFNENTALKPRDVLVMVPDINKYAPHIHAVFGQIQFSDKRFIPYSVTDQQERGHNSLVVAAEFLLNLPNSRFTASQIRWLLEIPAIRNRFDIEESSVPKLCQWIEGAQIRWGLNEKHREELGIKTSLSANTWKFGLNRMLLGYAVGNGEAFNEIEPYEEIGGLDSIWLGNLCQLIDTLEKYATKLNQNYSYETWLRLLNELLTDFFKSNDEKEGKTLDSLQSALKKWELHCKQANLTDQNLLSRNVVCDSWLSGMDEASFKKIFLSGKVNFCTLMPMRSIPFKVICVLGMNDGEFPRQNLSQSFDLMSLKGQYRPGDRSRRQDDQYVFLEALLSAREQFYVSWIGRNVRDNNKIPPSVLISQLREAIKRTWKLKDENKQLLDEITLEHPLQPFSRHYLEHSQYPRLFTYSHEWFCENEKMPLAKTNPETETDLTIKLETLGYFLKNPVKTYCNQTLKFYFDKHFEASEDDEPFTFDSLEQYKFKNNLLSDLKISSENVGDFFEQKKARLIHKGEIPLGNFAELSFEEVSEPVQKAWQHYQEHLNRWNEECEPISIEIEINGIKISDHVKTVRKEKGSDKLALVAVIAQKLKDKPHNLCQPWVQHLALCAMLDNFEKSYIFGSDANVVLEHVEKLDAKNYLEKIVSAWYENRNAVLSVAIKSAFAYLKNFNLNDAKTEYENKFNGNEVDSDAYLKRLFPRFEDFDEFEKWANSLYLPIQLNAS